MKALVISALALTALTGTVLAGTALAQGPCGRQGQQVGQPNGDFQARHAQLFTEIDTNGDGVISLTEFETHEPPRRGGGPGRGQGGQDQGGQDQGMGPGGGQRPDKAEIFARIDTNGDGQVSVEEWQAAPPPRHGGRQGRTG